MVRRHSSHARRLQLALDLTRGLTELDRCRRSARATAARSPTRCRRARQPSAARRVRSRIRETLDHALPYRNARAAWRRLQKGLTVVVESVAAKISGSCFSDDGSRMHTKLPYREVRLKRTHGSCLVRSCPETVTTPVAWQRQHHLKARAAGRRGADLDAPVVRHDDFLHERQTKAGSTPFGRDERAKDALAIRRGHARAVVIDTLPAHFRTRPGRRRRFSESSTHRRTLRRHSSEDC